MKLLRLMTAMLFLFPAIIMSSVTSVSLVNTSTASFYPVDTNKLVYRFSITAGTDDVLTAISVVNTKTADQSGDIMAVKAWYQAAGGTFNPAAAVLIGTLPRTATRTWGSAALNTPVQNGGSIYITVDIAVTPADNNQCAFRISKNCISFTGGGTFPSSDTTNSSTQTIVNNGYLYVSLTDAMPQKADAGQSNILAFRAGFYNSTPSGGSNISVSAIRLQSVNYASGVNMNASIARIIIKDGSTTYANYVPSGTSTTANISLSTAISVNDGGAAQYVDIYIYLETAVNTYDIGLRIPQAADITNGGSYTTRAYTGTSFPFATTRTLITTANNSVNVTRVDLMPGYVSRGQQGVKPFTLRFAHPQAVTIYADVVVSGVTLTAVSNPAMGLNALFSRVRISDGITTYSDTSALSGANSVWLPFASSMTVTSGTYRDVTAMVDILPAVSANDFYMSLSKTSHISAFSGSSGVTLTPVMAASLTSTSAVIQTGATGVSVFHLNTMPQYAAKTQKWVHAADITFTHLNGVGYAPIEIRGVTVTVENDSGINTPNSVMSGFTVLDASNNTLASASSMPASAAKLYINFSTSLIVPPGGSGALKFYLDVTGTTSETSIKLSLGAATAVNAVDKNSKLPVAVTSDISDSFPMKTSSVLILNPAVDIKARHADTMPQRANSGQQGVAAMSIALLNNTNGMVSVGRLRFEIQDNAGVPIPAADVVDYVRVEDFSNTSAAYYASAVTTTGSVLDMALVSPVIIGYSSSAPVTVSVKFNISASPKKNYFRAQMASAAGIIAKDYNLGNALPVSPILDSFPMNSSAVRVEARALSLNVSHTPRAAGPLSKGDVGAELIDLAFEAPGDTLTSSAVIYGITLTAENSSGSIAANTALSKVVVYEKGNPLNIYGSVPAMPAGQFVYVKFTNPVRVTPSASPGNLTVTVAADISPFASAPEFRISLSNGYKVGACDSNQMIAVSVTAKAPDTFPDMRSNLINLLSSNKAKLMHSDLMAETATNGQKAVAVMGLKFSNATDRPIAIHGLTLTAEDMANNGIIPSAVLAALYAVDDAGTTNGVVTAVPDSGQDVYMTFTDDVNIAASSYGNFNIIADLKDNTFTSAFKLEISAAVRVDAMPNTLIVEADSEDTFPMRSSPVRVQLKPSGAGLSHNDVIPTTASTGQSDIFAEILTAYNPNTADCADVVLSGLTLTVEDDTNTAINPSAAIKKITIKGDSGINASFTAVPNTVGSFYVPFSAPVAVGPGLSQVLKLNLDITDTLQASFFRINIKNAAAVRFVDANSGMTIAATAMNGDAFPMTTSGVIVQQRVQECRMSHADIMQPAYNSGQSGAGLLSISFTNPGGSNGANMFITRIVATVEDASNNGITPESVLSRIYVTDASGAVYGDVVSPPDYGDSASIGLTIPIIIPPGTTKQVFIKGNIDASPSAPGFRVDIKYASNVIARDSNSYDILPVTAYMDSFPMRSSYALIQQKTNLISASSANLMPAAVNKGQADVPVLYFEAVNGNPAGYSAAEVRGLTVTVMNSAAGPVAPSAVLSKLTVSDGVTVFGAQTAILSAGNKVFIPLSTPISLASGVLKGVTMYADIAPAASGLNLMLSLEDDGDISAAEINSGGPVTAVTGLFPMRSDATTIISTPGIHVTHSAAAPGDISGSQQNFSLLSLTFTNIGSFAEYVRYLTVTAKDNSGSGAPAGEIFSNMYIVDDGGDTKCVKAVSGAAPQIILDMSSLPLQVLPQSAISMALYADARDVTFSASYRVEAASAADVSATAAVSAGAGDSFPMGSGNFNLQQRNTGISVSLADLMPPSVSTGQPEVMTMMLSISGAGGPGYSPVIIKGISITVKDAASNTLCASKTFSRVRLTDFINDFADTAVIPDSEFINIQLPQPLTVSAGEVKYIYVIADMSTNTNIAAAGFKLALSSPDAVEAYDYNSRSMRVPVTGAFALESSAAAIQKHAVQLKVAHEDAMPARISTDQLNIPVMKLVFTDTGDTKTASVMITRLYLYLVDNLGANTLPQDVVKAVRISSGDGSVTYGETTVFSGNKITINLSAPVIVSAAVNVTVTVRVDAASLFNKPAFKAALVSAPDIYAVDANSFDSVPVVNKQPDNFPMMSGLSVLENRAQSADLGDFTAIADAQPAVTKAQKRVALYSFKVSDTMAANTAREIISGITVTVKNGAGSNISAGSCFDRLYAVDGSSNTLSSVVPGISNRVPMPFIAPVIISPSGYLYVTIFADILPAPAVQNFALYLESGGDVWVKDANSGYETDKNIIGPAMPWHTAAIGIFDAPATDLHAWHDGTLIPALIGKGQDDVKVMGLTLSNPCATGSADVIMHGVSVTVLDAAGVTLAPSSVIEGLKFADYPGLVTYGYATGSAFASAGPVYVAFDSPLPVGAMKTTTIYLSANVADNAAPGSVRFSISQDTCIAAHNNPAGYVTITAVNSDAFPMNTNLTSVTAATYFVGVCHAARMPVSAVRGQAGVKALELSFSNHNTADIGIKGITLTVKTRQGNKIPASSVISSVLLMDGAAIAGTFTATDSPELYLDPAGLNIPKGTEKTLAVVLGLSADCLYDFGLELETAGDITASPDSNMQAQAGDYFGNMKSGMVSVLAPATAESFHNYPNPFDPARGNTVVEYYLEDTSEVTLAIYTLDFRPVKILADRAVKTAGLHNEDTWDGFNSGHTGVRSGVYICVIDIKSAATGRSERLMRKIAVLR